MKDSKCMLCVTLLALIQFFIYILRLGNKYNGIQIRAVINYKCQTSVNLDIFNNHFEFIKYSIIKFLFKFH
jgi:hypothetical protein